MIVNSDFIRVVEANLQREKRIILGCQAGPRSTSAANMLQQVGFQDVSNLLGGFTGMRGSNRINQRSGLGEFRAAGQ